MIYSLKRLVRNTIMLATLSGKDRYSSTILHYRKTMLFSVRKPLKVTLCTRNVQNGVVLKWETKIVEVLSIALLFEHF